jgi:psp operon transcriptional activator
MREEKFNLIGQSSEFLSMLERLSQAAPLNRPLLLIGERGTGKELISARVHYLSKRWDRALVKLNCAALPENLLESELFGYEAGAFTGATKRVVGRFELAHQGTLFLDELATMDLRLQEKLLRVLEYGEFERLGGRETIKVDVRIIAATHADLPELVRTGKFRADLLDRLAFDVITLPPLRYRKDDILPLAEFYATRMTQELGRECFAGFSKACEVSLQNYGWPGNVRELKNVVERAVYQLESDEHVLDAVVFDPFASPYRKPANALVQPSDMTAAPASSVSEHSSDPSSFETQVRELELRLINTALEQAGGNQRKAAELLGLSYHQLRGLLRKYEIASPHAA